MAYFDGVKVGDRVWDFKYGWGGVIKINDLCERLMTVKFTHNLIMNYTMEGKTTGDYNQTLFWDEIKVEPPKHPKIKLNIDYSKVIDAGISKLFPIFYMPPSSINKMKKTARLLALRDQECRDSIGYEFRKGDENYYIEFYNGIWSVLATQTSHVPSIVFFKTREDAQKICDILNSGRFEL